MPNKHVVIVGCGFGGLECAKKLEGAPVEVTLVDRHNYHLFTPLLYQVATALLNPSDIAYPIRKIFRDSPNIRFRQAEVTAVDFDAHVVHVANGPGIPYDELVLATGSTTNYFGNEALADAALGLKNLEEALQLRNHILTCLERASAAAATGDTEALAGWLTFVVVGGGPTGVEFTGALAELFHLVLVSEYHNIAPGRVRIMLIEGSSSLLSAFDDRLGDYAARTLEARGVEVVLSKLVTEAGDDHVLLSDGEVVRTRTLVWSAGVRPEDPVAADAVLRSRSDRIEVGPDLRVAGHEVVYAIGDAASVTEDGRELPMLSPPAMQAGRYVASAILGDATGPFRYRDKGTMATIGRAAAVAQVGTRIRLTGWLGWVAWLVLHLYYLIGFHNRLQVLAAWGWNYLHGDRPIRIITRAKGDRTSSSRSAA
ncbi:MAG: NAD(P)/FAD-dependent oxidoreductase [Acidimicrobiia bacterium]|nr:NAD(P)/FAD-dependent oxidoreductase [Acidimicrobiia bacterium]